MHQIVLPAVKKAFVYFIFQETVKEVKDGLLIVDVTFGIPILQADFAK